MLWMKSCLPNAIVTVVVSTGKTAILNWTLKSAVDRPDSVNVEIFIFASHPRKQKFFRYSPYAFL